MKGISEGIILCGRLVGFNKRQEDGKQVKTCTLKCSQNAKANQIRMDFFENIMLHARIFDSFA